MLEPKIDLTIHLINSISDNLIPTIHTHIHTYLQNCAIPVPNSSNSKMAAIWTTHHSRRLLFLFCHHDSSLSWFITPRYCNLVAFWSYYRQRQEQIGSALFFTKNWTYDLWAPCRFWRTMNFSFHSEGFKLNLLWRMERDLVAVRCRLS